jgi:hypothetical protein
MQRQAFAGEQAELAIRRVLDPARRTTQRSELCAFDLFQDRLAATRLILFLRRQF